MSSKPGNRLNRYRNRYNLGYEPERRPHPKRPSPTQTPISQVFVVKCDRGDSNPQGDAPRDPKSRASASSATVAHCSFAAAVVLTAAANSRSRPSEPSPLISFAAHGPPRSRDSALCCKITNLRHLDICTPHPSTTPYCPCSVQERHLFSAVASPGAGDRGIPAERVVVAAASVTTNRDAVRRYLTCVPAKESVRTLRSVCGHIPAIDGDCNDGRFALPSWACPYAIERVAIPATRPDRRPAASSHDIPATPEINR